jgi:hypothetical protein
MELVASLLSRSPIGMSTRDLEAISANKKRDNEQHKHDHLHGDLLRWETGHLLSSQLCFNKEVITGNEECALLLLRLSPVELEKWMETQHARENKAIPAIALA